MPKNITRREFVKRSAVATAGLSLGLSAFAQDKKMSENDTILIGVIGTGDRGAYETEILQMTPGIRVTACCDIYPPHLANGLAGAEKGAKSYTDYRKLLENKDLDAVLICTPQHLHYQMALDALAAGKHIICQKTMTLNAGDAVSLSKAVKQSDSVFQVAYQWQNNPLFNEIRRMIQDGNCGQITHIRCNYNRNMTWRNPVPDPKFERLLNWRMYREYSGGLMAELCSHHINVVNWVLDKVPQKVTGFGGINFYNDGRETDDNVHTIFEYPGGVRAIYQSVLTNAFEDVSIIFMGTEGTITIRKEEAQQAHFYAEPKAVEQILTDEGVESVDAITSASRKAWARSEAIPITVANPTKDDFETTRAMFLDFADCVRNNKAPRSNVDNGRDVAICVDMALQAMANGSIETWKPEYSG
ncbi:MAG: Gfo/Idh/MocA family oxidoreductase [Calditrichaeota bacterium]|nr:Gfo/Idh/MocA family oxidoreductase [Calditrichota bacterium]